jgi:Mrp family chromosome partitioning ATPase
VCFESDAFDAYTLSHTVQTKGWEAAAESPLHARLSGAEEADDRETEEDEDEQAAGGKDEEEAAGVDGGACRFVVDEVEGGEGRSAASAAAAAAAAALIGLSRAMAREGTREERERKGERGDARERKSQSGGTRDSCEYT